jgi:hypothetical protein
MNFSSKYIFKNNTKPIHTNPQGESNISLLKNPYFDYEPNTNVLTIKFSKLKEKSSMQTGDAIKCQNCEAYLSQISKLEVVSNPDGSIIDGQKLWKCEFCNYKNNLKIDDEEIPTSDDVVYMLQPAPGIQCKTVAIDHSEYVVYCIDVSGSMSTSITQTMPPLPSFVPPSIVLGQHGHYETQPTPQPTPPPPPPQTPPQQRPYRTQPPPPPPPQQRLYRIQPPPPPQQRPYRTQPIPPPPPQQRPYEPSPPLVPKIPPLPSMETFLGLHSPYGNRVSRLEAVKIAISENLTNLEKDYPNKRVGLVTFGSQVVSFGDGSTEEVIISDDNLNKKEFIARKAILTGEFKRVKDTIKVLNEKVLRYYRFI